MAMDFLGKEPAKKRRIFVPVAMHQPTREKPSEIKTPPLKKISAPVRPNVIEEEEEEINLLTSFKSYLLKRRIELSVLVVMILALVAVIGYFWATRPVKVVINTNLNQTPPLNIQVSNQNLNQIIYNQNINANENLNLPLPPPAPVCGNGVIEPGEQCDLTGCLENQICVDCQCQTVILPDTPLAPLRGALVKFKGSPEIFLIEKNGELRLVEQENVVFLSGKNVSKLDPSMIYLLNDKFLTTRHGKDVKGQIAWDPRVLTAEELAPFK